MSLPPHARAYELWAPVVARIMFGLQFLLGAAFKVPGTGGFTIETTQAAAVGLPFASFFVFLAFMLEVVAGLALVVGWYVRSAALVLAVFTLALAFIFYRNIADPMTMGMFISHLAFIAGLLYISVYGAQRFAIRRDSLPLA